MKKVREFCNELINVFDLQSWDTTILKDSASGNADVLIDHRYKTIRIRIFKNFFEESSKDQASTLIHEFCHTFNVPVHNLLYEQWNGKLITQAHSEDILEQSNVRAEKVIVKLLTDDTLRKAYKKYTSNKKKLRSVK